MEGGRAISARLPRAARSTMAPSSLALFVLLGAGVGLRLVLAYVLFPDSGAWADRRLLAGWSLALADGGPGTSIGTVDAGPTAGMTWILWIFGLAMKVLAGLTGGAAPELIPEWLKLTGIIGDAVAALVAWRIVRRGDGERWGLVAAGAVLFLPPFWYDSALWGGLGGVGNAVGLFALERLIAGRSIQSAITAMVAVLVAPAWWFLAPIIAVVLIQRYHRTSGVAGTRALILAALGALGVAVLVVTPTAAGIGGSLGVGSRAAFYGPWSLLGDAPLSRTLVDHLIPPPPGPPFVGVVLLLATLIGVSLLIARRPDRETILLGSLTLATGTAVLLASASEHALLPAIAVAVLLLPRGRAWWGWVAGATSLALVNLHAILTLPDRAFGTPELRTLALGEVARQPIIVLLGAVLALSLLVWPLMQCVRAWRMGRVFADVGVVLVGSVPPHGPSQADLVPAVFLRRVRGPGAGPSVILTTLVSLAAAIVAVRFGGPDGPWLWNYDLPPFMYPFAGILHDAVSAGRIPLWTDAVAMGMPLAAEGQIGALYPPNWLIFQLPPLLALDATRVIHLVLAGVGSGLVTLRLSGSRTGMLLTSLIVVLGGGIAGKLEWHQLVVVYGWLPWMLLALLWERPGPSYRAVGIAGIVLGVAALAGYPPMWTLMGIAGVAAIFARVRSWRAIPAVAVLGLVTLGVGAMQLIPTLLLLPLSDRSAGLDAAALFEWSATPFDPLLFSFLNPFVPANGTAQAIDSGWYPANTFWAVLEGSAYVGLAALALAIPGLATRRARPLIWIALVFIAIPVIGLMKPEVVASIPFVNGLRHPIRAYTILGPLLGIAAGIGLARMGRDLSRRLALLAVAAAVGWYVATLTFAVTLPDLFESTLRAFGDPGMDAARLRLRAIATLTSPIPVVVEVLLATILLMMLGMKRSPWMRLAAVAMIAIPMAVWVPTLNPILPRERFDLAATPLGRTITELRPAGLLALYEGPAPAATLTMHRLEPGARAFSPRFFTRLFLGATGAMLGQVTSALPDTAPARAIGIDLILSYGGACPGGNFVASDPETGGVLCAVDGSVRPPYWIPAGLVTTTEAAAPGSPFDVTADPAAVIGRAIPAEVIERGPSYGEYRIVAPEDGYLFVDRSWYPYWTVEVDGAPVPTYRLWSGTLVPISAGSHVVAERHEPRDVQIGATITILTLVLTGGLLTWSRFRRLRRW